MVDTDLSSCEKIRSGYCGEVVSEVCCGDCKVACDTVPAWIVGHHDRETLFEEGLCCQRSTMIEMQTEAPSRNRIRKVEGSNMLS